MNGRIIALAVSVAVAVPVTVPSAAAPGGTDAQAAPSQLADGSRNSLQLPGVRRVGRIAESSFGIHSYAGAPGLSAGTFRLACAPTWNKVQLTEKTFNWASVDDMLNRVRSYGYSDVLFSFCGTPGWAAKKPLPRPDVQPYWGKYGSAAPAKMTYWRDFVTKFVARYHSRISAYEVWNEATSPYLWQGTPAEMAQMTRILHDVVRSLDPTADVVSANSQTVEQSAWFNSFFPKYMRALATRGWPVDAVSIHTYAGAPDTTPAEGLRKRVVSLREVVAAMKKARVPSRIELWDTETNYLGRARSRSYQQALVARTYLDSWRFGVTRTYWYMWTKERNSWLGVQMRRGAPGVQAYNTLASWTRNATFRGCLQKKGYQSCRFTRGGHRFAVAYTDGIKPVRAKVKGKVRVCRVNGGKCFSARKRVRVTFLPVRIA